MSATVSRAAKGALRPTQALLRRPQPAAEAQALELGPCEPVEAALGQLPPRLRGDAVEAPERQVLRRAPGEELAEHRVVGRLATGSLDRLRLAHASDAGGQVEYEQGGGG